MLQERRFQSNPLNQSVEESKSKQFVSASQERFVRKRDSKDSLLQNFGANRHFRNSSEARGIDVKPGQNLSLVF